MDLKRVFIETIGCQMNVYDSERIVRGLKPFGYEEALAPDEADVILLNTCSIREKAEQKAFSFLGRLAWLKKENPKLIIGVGGCVAQQEGATILRRAPYVDLVFGTHAVGRIPELIDRIARRRCRIVDVKMSDRIEEDSLDAAAFQGTGMARFVTIMRGCDNYCAYCVVPYVRGRETSRNPEDILSEIRALVDAGVREVTLLGQNVNSYGQKEGLCSFPELLARVNDVEGLLRIRFTTSHPKDLSDDLIAAFQGLGKLCRHFHLPVQSGSDAVLARMNRKYTRQRYLERIDALQTACPDLALTSDFIVGFPGETDEDFEETLELMRRVRFDGVFAFKYSDRPNAPATAFPLKVSEEIKSDRLKRLFDLQAEIGVQKNQALVGSVATVLVEGGSKRQTDRSMEWTGRTSSNKIVNFCWESGEDLTGKLLVVSLEKAFAHSFWGEPMPEKTLKGAHKDAA